ncbi:MAG: tRNA 4-thiouridine(8) synthase ThiI [Coriobacteriales bacterium]|jgi:thiamine biosynthesis protein ThiI|nr:tRNA 4-thiouridine(8) synthase ThiI [Coriobacteriales bacterium]
MIQPVVLIHYHELGLKGKNRRDFERQLIRNIQKTLAQSGLEGHVNRTSGRILVAVSTFEAALSAADALVQLPGVARVSCGERLPKDMAAINESALRALQRAEPFTSFKVDARRANTQFPLDSMAINREVGSYLSARLPHKNVQMRAPDAKARVEIIKNDAFVYASSRQGIGGLPVGCSGHLICLLSSGLDSPVAAWQMMRRGAQVTGLHFSGAPETADHSSALVREIARRLAPTGGPGRLFFVRFGGYQRAIALTVPESLRVVFYRRLMLATAEALAAREHARALVTGESLGQVASQTLDNIVATDAAVSLPVFRPLIGTDKQAIIKQAQALGTFALSTQPVDDCCTLFMPRNPETHANLAEVERIWSEMPIDAWIREILAELRSETL